MKRMLRRAQGYARTETHMPETKDPNTAGARSYQHKGFGGAVRLYEVRWQE
jgi:hypothetical protein